MSEKIKKVLVIGSDGFIGRHVFDVMSEQFDTYGTVIAGADNQRKFQIDLLKPATIQAALSAVEPDIIINNAGIIDSERAKLNVAFTKNLLESIVACGFRPQKIIISGSAAEYGVIRPEEAPVNENTELRADTGYGLGKRNETAYALDYAAKHNLTLVVARIFNPIGVGMHPKLLLPQLIEQIKQVRSGERKQLEVGRLDARRDYVDVEDIALAIRDLACTDLPESVYNIGSGQAMSNKELIELLLNHSKLDFRPKVVQTNPEKEPLYAYQADISRIKRDCNWRPTRTIDEVLEELMRAE